MPAYVALLRAVNVGGTGKLAMRDLRAACEQAGFESVGTYIASGNAVFLGRGTEDEVKAALAARLRALAGAPIGVFVRSATEIAAVAANNPFPEAPPGRVVAIFLDCAPPADALSGARGRDGEEIQLGRREIYVCYPHGIGVSKLRIPAAEAGTARNMRTVAKLAEMAAEL